MAHHNEMTSHQTSEIYVAYTECYYRSFYSIISGTLQLYGYYISTYSLNSWTTKPRKPSRLIHIIHRKQQQCRAEIKHQWTTTQDLQEGKVMPPQAAAIIMYSNRTIKHVKRAL